MFSLARSRYSLVSQLVFLCTNAGGLLVGVIYNARTPDLYPNNAHHKLGWVTIGLLARVGDAFARTRRRGAESRTSCEVERQSLMPVSTAAMVEHDSAFPNKPYRYSNDSGQGTEPKTESLWSPRSSSGSGSSRQSERRSDSPPVPLRDVSARIRRKQREDEGDGSSGGGDAGSLDDYLGTEKLLRSERDAPRSEGPVRGLARRMVEKVSSKTWTVLLLGYNVVDRTILILGFMALCTGIITYARFFVSGVAVRWSGVSLVWLVSRDQAPALPAGSW